jgi:S1-C subfamily serine protease
VLSYLRPWAFSLLLAAGCASAPPAEPVTASSPAIDAAIAAEEGAPAPASSAPAGPKRPVPEGHLRREDVMGVLSEGAPAFLQKIEVEPTLDREGHFQGWRVVQIRDPLLASGDLQRGDVVRRVNGQSVENPYQFFEVFQSLAFAPELQLSIARGAESRDLRYPISDDPSAPPIPKPTLQGPPPTAASATGEPPGAAAPAPAPKKKKKKR